MHLSFPASEVEHLVTELQKCLEYYDPCGEECGYPCLIFGGFEEGIYLMANGIDINGNQMDIVVQANETIADPESEIYNESQDLSIYIKNIKDCSFGPEEGFELLDLDIHRVLSIVIYEGDLVIDVSKQEVIIVDDIVEDFIACGYPAPKVPHQRRRYIPTTQRRSKRFCLDTTRSDESLPSVFCEETVDAEQSFVFV